MKKPTVEALADPPGPETILVTRVVYADTDQMGIVNSGCYMRWLEMGRTEYIRARGKTYRQVEEQDGLFLPVAEVYLRYRSSARYDDQVRICTSLAKLTGARIAFNYRLLRHSDETVLALGQTMHPITNSQGRVLRIPPAFKQLLLNAPISA